MKNLKVKAFKTVEAAAYFVQEENGGLPTGCEHQLRTKGYYQVGKHHVVVDPDGEIEKIAPKPWETKTSLSTWLLQVLLFIPAMIVFCILLATYKDEPEY